MKFAAAVCNIVNQLANKTFVWVGSQFALKFEGYNMSHQLLLVNGIGAIMLTMCAIATFGANMGRLGAGMCFC